MEGNSSLGQTGFETAQEELSNIRKEEKSVFAFDNAQIKEYNGAV